jgi:hypothetical protein
MRSERVGWHEISSGGQRGVIIDEEMYGIPLGFNKAYSIICYFFRKMVQQGVYERLTVIWILAVTQR